MTRLLLILPTLFLFSACCNTGMNRPAGTARNPVVAETLLKTTKTWNGDLLPPYREGQPEVTILRIIIAPGVALPDHTHPVMNAGVLLRGKLLVTTEDGKTNQLEAGDALAEVVDTWHYGKNNGNGPAEIIVVYAGIEGEPVTVKRKDAQ